MPIPSSDAVLASSPGTDAKRKAARRALALEFLSMHLYEAEGDWNLVTRALLCMDLDEPVVVGPHPAAPKRLVALPQHALGQGFFAAEPSPSDPAPLWRNISPESRYLKWSSPVAASQKGLDAQLRARYLVPGARLRAGARPLVKER